MLRRVLPTLWLVTLLLAACQPVATPPPAATAAPTSVSGTPTPTPHADAIRFALVGDTTLTNVWAYFDDPGTNYNNRAVQAEFWPSLYRLSPVTGAFEPYLAGTVSPIEPDAGFFASTVTLRSNLFWSDGTPLTAADVAFTVNTSLQFHLGLDWAQAYDPAVLDHAVAASPQAVRFYFRSQPNIEAWQYGALQGPIVNAAYWEPRLAQAASMLTPNPALDQEILALQNQRSQLQAELKDLLSQLATLDSTSVAYTNMDMLIYNKQEEINGVDEHIGEKRAAIDSVFATARSALYALPPAGEPTFGPFLPGRRAAGEFENDLNPRYSFVAPNFDRVIYRIYPDMDSAIQAVYAGEVNAVLAEGGGPAPGDGGAAAPSAAPEVAQQWSTFSRNDLRVLAFNLDNPFLGDFSFRQALVCMVTQHFSPDTFHYPDGLLLSEQQFGFTSGLKYPCEGLDMQTRLAQAVSILESGGYGWTVKPDWDGTPRAGSGLKRGKNNVLQLSILVAQDESIRMEVASAIAEQLQILGVDVQVEKVDESDLLYRVYDSGEFDMALLGWRLADYPAYLCDLFGPGNPFAYDRVEMTQHCTAFRAALDLEVARQEAAAIQTLLAQDVPVVPLYSDVGYDLLSGVTYPSPPPLNGVSGMYGAPWLAIPATP